MLSWDFHPMWIFALVRIRQAPSYTVARHQCEHQIFNDDNCAVAAVRFTIFFFGASRNFKDLAPFSASIFTERLNWKKPENKLNISSILIHFIQSCVRMEGWKPLPKKDDVLPFFCSKMLASAEQWSAKLYSENAKRELRVVYQTRRFLINFYPKLNGNDSSIYSLKWLN